MIRIRRGQLTDEEELSALDRATWNTLSSPAPVPGPERAFFQEGTAVDDVLVALVDDEVAGYVKLGRPTDLAASDHVCTVSGIAVAPGHQRGGVGRRLIEAAVEEARRRRARRLTLRVLGPNEGARALYASAGFVVEGVQRGEFLLDGEYVDDVLMALDLTSRA